MQGPVHEHDAQLAEGASLRAFSDAPLDDDRADALAFGAYADALAGLIDNPETDPAGAASFGTLQPYLTVMGTPVTTEAQLMAGTGGRTVTSYGSYNTGLSLSKAINPAYVTPSMQPIITMINSGPSDGAGG